MDRPAFFGYGAGHAAHSATLLLPPVKIGIGIQGDPRMVSLFPVNAVQGESLCDALASGFYGCPTDRNFTDTDRNFDFQPAYKEEPLIQGVRMCKAAVGVFAHTHPGHFLRW